MILDLSSDASGKTVNRDEIHAFLGAAARKWYTNNFLTQALGGPGRNRTDV